MCWLSLCRRWYGELERCSLAKKKPEAAPTPPTASRRRAVSALPRRLEATAWRFCRDTTGTGTIRASPPACDPRLQGGWGAGSCACCESLQGFVCSTALRPAALEDPHVLGELPISRLGFVLCHLLVTRALLFVFCFISPVISIIFSNAAYLNHGFTPFS